MGLISIAGFVGDGPSSASKLCRKALVGLSDFGQAHAVVDFDSCSFGRVGGSSADCCLEKALHHGIVIVGDCRIDNGAELSAALGIQGSDASVLLVEAWLQWGSSTFDRLIGEFALGVYDVRSRELWLARDVSGERPLFYNSQNGIIGFASMPSGLLGAWDGSADLSHAARFVDRLQGEKGRTFWQDIKSVSVGSVLHFSKGSSAEWSLLAPDQQSSELAWPAQIQAIRHRLDTAVLRNIRNAGDVITVQLSSGFDSSAVASTAARLLSSEQRLLALTAAPPLNARLLVQRGRFPDESSLASLTAQHGQMEHLIIRNEARYLDSIRGMSRYFQQPPPAHFSFPWWLEMARTAKDHGSRILLNGGHGNSVISYGGLVALSRYLASGRFGTWLREMRLARRHEDVRIRGMLFNSFRPLLPEWAESASMRLAHGLPSSPITFVRREWQQRVLPPERLSYNAMRRYFIETYDVGWRKRGMFALTGIEERDPCGDRDLINFSLSLPPDAHLRNGKIKALIREALRDRVPASVLESRQRGMCGTDWYERIGPADSRAALEEIKMSASASQLLNTDALALAIDEWPPFDPARQVWLTDFGRSIGRALSTGLFLAETDRYPLGAITR